MYQSSVKVQRVCAQQNCGLDNVKVLKSEHCLAPGCPCSLVATSDTFHQYHYVWLLQPDLWRLFPPYSSISVLYCFYEQKILDFYPRCIRTHSWCLIMFNFECWVCIRGAAIIHVSSSNAVPTQPAQHWARMSQSQCHPVGQWNVLPAWIKLSCTIYKGV